MPQNNPILITLTPEQKKAHGSITLTVQQAWDIWSQMLNAPMPPPNPSAP